MSALGHKQTFRGAIATSALSPKADLRRQGCGPYWLRPDVPRRKPSSTSAQIDGARLAS